MDFIRTHKKATLITSAIILVVIIVTVGIALLTAGKDATEKTTIIEDTGFQTVLPSGKQIKDLGGWERISPLNTAPVYAFADTINDIVISVSQQPLPFTSDADTQVAQLAAAYSATTTLSANGVKVYIGTSAKGPQSTIFSKNGLLILIKSQEKIQDSAWISYINSLN